MEKFIMAPAQARRTESYPHPLFSCMMPVAAMLIVMAVGMIGFNLWKRTLPQDIKIPKINGVSQYVAISRLTNAGLKYEVIDERHSSEKIPADSIIASIPEEGRFVKKGRIIRLLVSSGSQFTKVPSVKGLSHGVARNLLAKATLKISTETSKFDDEVPMDCIISISPMAGTKVYKNSEVKLVLSKGKESDLDLGLTDDAARSFPITVNIPLSENEPGEVRIDVEDDNGFRTIYRETHSPGESFTEMVDGVGKTTVNVYFADRLLLTKVK